MELERKKEHLTAVEREMKANENALAQRDTEIVRMKTGINSFSVSNVHSAYVFYIAYAF